MISKDEDIIQMTKKNKYLIAEKIKKKNKTIINRFKSHICYVGLVS